MTDTQESAVERDDEEIVIRGVNDRTYEIVVDALEAAGVNTEVVRRA